MGATDTEKRRKWIEEAEQYGKQVRNQSNRKRG
jgi:hypothetical protein